MGATLDLIQIAVAAGQRMLSDHAFDRLLENAILVGEVAAGLAAAVEIEDYPDAFKGPSVLVLQTDAAGRPIHVVWGLRKGTTTPAILVTAYRPDPARWSSDFRRRL